MNRRDIGMDMVPLLTVDFDALLLPPENWHKQYVLRLLKRWRWLDWKLQRITIRWHSLDPQANVAAYWLIDHGLRLSVIVRRRYTLGLHSAVESVLEQHGGYPATSTPTFFLVPDDLSIQEQAAHIRMFCNQYGAYRFYTKDFQLSRVMPASLCKLVEQWDGSILEYPKK